MKIYKTVLHFTVLSIDWILAYSDSANLASMEFFAEYYVIFNEWLNSIFVLSKL